MMTSTRAWMVLREVVSLTFHLEVHQSDLWCLLVICHTGGTVQGRVCLHKNNIIMHDIVYVLEAEGEGGRNEGIYCDINSYLNRNHTQLASLKAMQKVFLVTPISY